MLQYFLHSRSCQTCRDKITERKRYLSKSREAIFEKVNQSKLKKSLSKSRERLPVCGLTLSKSRDNLGLGLQDNLYPGGQTKVIFLRISPIGVISIVECASTCSRKCLFLGYFDAFSAASNQYAMCNLL